MALAHPAQNEITSESSSPLPVTPIAVRQIPPKTMILWLVASSLLIAFLPLVLFSNSVNSDVQGMSSDLGFIQASMTKVPTPGAAVQKLLTPIAQVQSQQSQLNSVLPTLTVARFDLPSVMTVIGSYSTKQISITAMSLTATSLTLTGRATNDNAVTAYSHMLEQSGLFSRVVLQSIRVVAPVAGAAPPIKTSIPISSSLSMPAATATPAPMFEFVILVELKAKAS